MIIKGSSTSSTREYVKTAIIAFVLGIILGVSVVYLWSREGKRNAQVVISELEQENGKIEAELRDSLGKLEGITERIGEAQEKVSGIEAGFEDIGAGIDSGIDAIEQGLAIAIEAIDLVDGIADIINEDRGP